MVVVAESVVSDSEVVIVENCNNIRLSVEQENVLVQQVQERTSLIKEKGACQTNLERQVSRKGEIAINQLLAAHEYLIRNLVRHHQSPGQRHLDPDLQSEAIAEFIDAIQRFDPTRGARLSSYAYFRIRARLQALRDKANQQAIAVGKSYYEPQVTEAPEAEDTNLKGQLLGAIEKLPERQKLVIQLLLENLTCGAIAERLDSGIKAIQALCYRARKALRSLLVAPAPTPVAKFEPTEAIAPESRAVKKGWPRARLPKILRPVRGIFAKLPTTSTEVVYQGLQLSLCRCWMAGIGLRYSQRRIMKRTLGENLMKSVQEARKARTADRSSNRQLSVKARKTGWVNLVSRYIPPLWVNLGLLSVATHFARDPFFDSLTIALWMGVLYLYLIGQLARIVSINISHRRWFTSLGAAGIGMLSMPQVIFAQNQGGGTGSCANAGFLNKLAEFSTSVLTSNTGGAVTNLNSFICQFIGMLALIAIIMMVGGFIYAGFEVTVRQQALATVAQPVVGIVITVIFCVVTIYIMSNPT